MIIIVACGHVHADLDDGRADEHVQLAVAEAGHLRVAVGGLQPAVDEPDPERREQLREAGGLGLRRGRPRRLHVLVREVVVARPAAVLVPVASGAAAAR